MSFSISVHLTPLKHGLSLNVELARKSQHSSCLSSSHISGAASTCGQCLDVYMGAAYIHYVFVIEILTVAPTVSGENSFSPLQW